MNSGFHLSITPILSIKSIPENTMKAEPLIPKHGGYRRLKSFQVAQLVYDVTVRFCDRYIDKRSRTHDQMVQAARSGVQNIAEGSQASGTSKKFEWTPGFLHISENKIIVYINDSHPFFKFFSSRNRR